MLPQDFFSPLVQSFIRDLEGEDPESIVLKNKTIAGLPSSFIADQIRGRKKAKEKLPVYYANPLVAYPPKVNLEQSSSETTGRYKIELIKKLAVTSFNSCVDLTGGFGVDSYFLSSLFKTVVYVEPNKDLLEIAASNHRQLGASNIEHINSDASAFIFSEQTKFDLIYVDPSRRQIGNQKVHSFSQSEPDVLELLSRIFDRTNTLLIKASPLLDIHLGLKELKSVDQVSVVAVNNDCKEVLFFLTRERSSEEPNIHTINIRTSSSEVFDFLFSKEQQAEISFSDPLDFLYEPNAAIMKAGAFKSISKRFEVKKIHQNTHLYTSSSNVVGFPGRTFKIIAEVKTEPRELKRLLPDGKANVITRNYPLSVDELRKKTKLAEGGELYLIAFSGAKKKFVVVAERLT